MQRSITMQEEALPVVKSSLEMKRKALEFIVSKPVAMPLAAQPMEEQKPVARA